MIRMIILVVASLAFNIAGAQHHIIWADTVQLTFNDFKSSQTEINPELTTYSLTSGTRVDFSFHMSNYEFMFTKNFNSKVKCIFDTNSATLIAIDSTLALSLVDFAQFTFDLGELYARKMRQQLYVNKGVFTNTSFFQPIYNDLQREMNDEINRVMKVSDLGRNSEVLQMEHDKVRRQIPLYPEFCYSCKPTKRKVK